MCSVPVVAKRKRILFAIIAYKHDENNVVDYLCTKRPNNKHNRV